VPEYPASRAESWPRTWRPAGVTVSEMAVSARALSNRAMIMHFTDASVHDGITVMWDLSQCFLGRLAWARRHLDSCQVRHCTSTYDVVRTSYDIVRQTYEVVFNIARTISYVQYYIRYCTYDIVRLSTS
jgi:hypothetical protein